MRSISTLILRAPPHPIGHTTICTTKPTTTNNKSSFLLNLSRTTKTTSSSMTVMSATAKGPQTESELELEPEPEMTAIENGRSRIELNKGIAQLYDESTGIWEDIWGDHLHHGFYDPSQPPESLSNHRSAQIRMIEETLRFAGLSDEPSTRPKQIVDVGCGIGGSSRYLAKKYGARCEGITLSPFQAQRAQTLAVAEGLADKAFFQVADALEQPFADGQFDLVWSMESGEHMPDKRKFVTELARVAAPGATIIIVTWCHRDLSPSEESLQPDEKELLRKICDSYYLPAWCSTADYVKILESLSLQDIKAADWSEYVAPFWPAVIRSALTWKGLTSLLRSESGLIIRMEDNKGSPGDAIDDPGIQEESYQICYNYMSKARALQQQLMREDMYYLRIGDVLETFISTSVLQNVCMECLVIRVPSMQLKICPIHLSVLRDGIGELTSGNLADALAELRRLYRC